MGVDLYRVSFVGAVPERLQDIRAATCSKREKDGLVEKAEQVSDVDPEWKGSSRSQLPSNP